jgi:hypothetical protein
MDGSELRTLNSELMVAVSELPTPNSELVDLVVETFFVGFWDSLFFPLSLSVSKRPTHKGSRPLHLRGAGPLLNLLKEKNSRIKLESAPFSEWLWEG